MMMNNRSLTVAFGIAAASALVGSWTALASAGTLPAVGSGDLILHLDARRGVTTSSGGLVDQWVDQETTNTSLDENGNNVTTTTFSQTGSSRPTLIANATPTGESAIDFDGADDYLQSGEFFSFSEFTMFAVIKADADDDPLNTDEIYRDYGDGSEMTNLVVDTSDGEGFGHTVRDDRGNPIRIDVASGSESDAEQWNVVTSRLTFPTGGDPTLDLFVNGELTATASHSLYLTDTTFEAVGNPGAPTIGAFPNGNLGYFNGQLASFLIYRGSLSDPDRAAVEDSLSTTFIPEPASALLLGLGGLMALSRRLRA